jgi:hypothetical protein
MSPREEALSAPARAADAIHQVLNEKKIISKPFWQ